MATLQEKELKMVNGLHIVKTWETDRRGIIKGSIIYMVNDEEDNLNCFRSLKEAREYARNWR